MLQGVASGLPGRLELQVHAFLFIIDHILQYLRLFHNVQAVHAKWCYCIWLNLFCASKSVTQALGKGISNYEPKQLYYLCWLIERAPLPA